MEDAGPGIGNIGHRHTGGGKDEGSNDAQGKHRPAAPSASMYWYLSILEGQLRIHLAI
jgi:hypothetical protein